MEHEASGKDEGAAIWIMKMPKMQMTGVNGSV
jgi:hypothetical protein